MFLLKSFIKKTLLKEYNKRKDIHNPIITREKLFLSDIWMSLLKEPFPYLDDIKT